MQRGKAVTLRAYQKRIVDESITDNTLVVLPTGAGKTLIAGEIIRRTGVPALFLVPTVLLVSQQRQALAEWTGMNVEPYCGAMALPRSFDILVSTPKAFELAQTKPANKHFQWGALRTVVFDEVHHVLKNHPYRMLALSLRSSPSKPYVMGLTASYTYAVGESKVKKQLTTLCKELLIKNLQTADDDELRASGYHALGTKSERPAAAIAADDECPPGVVPRDERKPHLMLKMFINRIVKKTGTTFAQALMATVLEMEKEAARLDSGFKPLVMEGGSVKSWGSAANKRAVVAARRRGSGNLPAIFQQLENWYESLRLLIVSWEESDFLSVLLLRMTLCDSETAKDMWSHSVQSTMGRFWKAAPTDFRRLNNLRETLLAKFHEKNPFRGILFVQQRITTHILEHFVANDQQLSLQFSTACIYASSTPATPSFRVTKAQAQERLSDFAAGKVNLLITTVVAEEGKFRSKRR